MRNPKLNFNEVVRYIGQDCMHNGYTYLKQGDIVHIERQMTAKKIVVFALRFNGGEYTIKMPRELFETLPNRPNMLRAVWGGGQVNEDLNILNRDVRYVIGQML